MRQAVAASFIVGAAVFAAAAAPVRSPVLGQIALPHNYYYRELYLPQLTSGPSSAAWTPDGSAVIYSMQGSLWRQRTDSTAAEQLTDDGGADYQPDCSPDGKSVVFVRYDGRAMELMLLDLDIAHGAGADDERRASTSSRAGRRMAAVSPTCRPPGSGHFLLHVAEVRDGRIANSRPLTAGSAQRASTRYYYSPFDHAINPAWTRDGKELVFVSNREIAHGTGDIVRMAVDGRRRPAAPAARGDVVARAARMSRPTARASSTAVISGANGSSCGCCPSTAAIRFRSPTANTTTPIRVWSPDGRTIAFISNRSGNTALWLIDADLGEATSAARRRAPVSAAAARAEPAGRGRGGQHAAGAGQHHRQPPSRAARQTMRGFMPTICWCASASRSRRAISTAAAAAGSRCRSIGSPITVSHGPAYEIAHLEEDARAAGWSGTRTVTLKRLPAPPDSGEWWSGDLHVHMNYGGLYRNTPSRLADQGRAEDLNLIYNLVVNKEQRFPDIASFRPDPDPASTDRLLILHGQEFHTSYWGHLSILNLTQHLLLPGYAGYPFTAAASPYPHNAAVADMAHLQQALVGYAHPFDEVVDTSQADPLTNALPIDAALGKIDYYEAVGFSDHKATNAVWYRLLECGLEIPAGAGTDAMANYASLRGPVGLNRVYVPATGALTRDAFLAQVKQGRGTATNGALLQLKTGDARSRATPCSSPAGRHGELPREPAGKLPRRSPRAGLERPRRRQPEHGSGSAHRRCNR